MQRDNMQANDVKAAGADNPANARSQLEQLQQGYRTLSESQNFLTVFILSMLMSYHSLELQKKQIVRLAQGREPAGQDCIDSIQKTTSFMNLIGAYYFYSLTRQSFETADLSALTKSQACALRVNYSASALSIIAILLRIYSICFCANSASASSNRENTAEEEAVQTEEDVEFP